MKKILTITITLFTLLITSDASAQVDPKLAQQYYINGEFEKAASLYQQLYLSGSRNTYYFGRYIESLLSLEDFDEAEKAIKKAIKRNPKNVELYVTYGKLYERQYLDEPAKQQYQKAIKELPAEKYAVTKLANAFIGLTKYDLATQAYERGIKILNDQQIFAYNLADLYRRKGDKSNMIKYYLLSLKANQGRINSVKTTFQRYLKTDDYPELQSQLYTLIQDEPKQVTYPEILSWTFIQQKDYRNALRQDKALDIKLQENGGRIFNLGNVARLDKDYQTAILAYQYVIDKSDHNTYYFEAKGMLLHTKRLMVVDNPNFTSQDLISLQAEYISFLDEFGWNTQTAHIIEQLAEIEALYINDIDQAITYLNRLVELPNLNPQQLGRAKLALADNYLIQGERWEATLLYSQVDKTFKDDIMGHQARFKNAKLSYYFGDFEWAQAQFDVLKTSTSKLIANDALDLSVFIQDNLGLDTTTQTMELYAQAELLTYQNKLELANNKLKELAISYPDHSLSDDILYAQAHILLRKRAYQSAADIFQTIIDNHPDEIRADNALFEMAELYESPYQLDNLEKAKELYQKIFIDYSNSTLSVEARKRFRKLRGDDI